MDIIYDSVTESGEGALFVRTAIATGAAPAIFISRVAPKANIDMTQSFTVHSLEEINILRKALDAAESNLKEHNVPPIESRQT